jgi:hypothetical protein
MGVEMGLTLDSPSPIFVEIRTVLKGKEDRWNAIRRKIGRNATAPMSPAPKKGSAVSASFIT